MSVYFSQSPLGAGETSRPFTLPAGALVMTVFRDLGLRLADGTAETDLPAPVTLRQLSNDGVSYLPVVTVNATGSFGVMADPGNGPCTITNAGPGAVQCVSIADYER